MVFAIIVVQKYGNCVCLKFILLNQTLTGSSTSDMSRFDTVLYHVI